MSAEWTQCQFSMDGGKTWALCEIKVRSQVASELAKAEQWNDDFGTTYKRLETQP